MSDDRCIHDLPVDTCATCSKTDDPGVKWPEKVSAYDKY